MNPYSVSFAQNDISLVDGVDLYNHDFNQNPKRDIKINKIARQDKSIITSSEYTSKEVPVYADVCGSSRGGTEAKLTYLKSLLQGQNEELKVSQGGDTVTYVATLNEFNVEWDGINALVTMIFIASDPIGESTTQTTLFSGTITTGATSFTSVIGGSFLVEPTINLTINSITGGTGSMTISNSGTQQGITLTGTFTASTIVIIDSKEQEATINGAAVDFTGKFPVYYPGTQSLGYTDTFTTRNISLAAQGNLRTV